MARSKSKNIQIVIPKSDRKKIRSGVIVGSVIPNKKTKTQLHRKRKHKHKEEL